MTSPLVVTLAILASASVLLGQMRPRLAHQCVEGHKEAIVIGIDYDESIGRLQFGVADASAIRNALELMGYRVKLLVGKMATRQRILDELDAVRAERQFERKGILLVYFSGHGITKAGTSYLLPADYPRGGGISMAEIDSRMAATDAGSRAMFVDACRNETKAIDGATKGFVLELNDPTPRSASASGAHRIGTAGLMSALVSKVVREFPALGHGAFTHFLERGLLGENGAETGACVAFNPLALYVGENVHGWTRANDTAYLQEPYQTGEYPPSLVIGPNTRVVRNLIDEMDYVRIGPPLPPGVETDVWIAQTEVTVAAYSRVMKIKTSEHENRFPVVDVSTKNAADYCEKVGGRIPTTTEWSAAASYDYNSWRNEVKEWKGFAPEDDGLSTRGEPLLRPRHVSEYANFDGYGGRDFAPEASMPVASMLPNGAGLFDMGGNVAEFAWDPLANRYVRMGGSYKDKANKFGPRSQDPATGKGTVTGFRCVMDRATIKTILHHGDIR